MPPRRLVLLHGFTQTGESWQPIRSLLAAGHEIVTPDAPGHGTNADERTGMPATAATWAERHGPAVWLGYSMGGRLALHVALEHPEAVTGLVLVSASPGVEDAAERAARRHADDALADDIEGGTVGAFIDRWLAGPLWATLPRERAGIDHRLTNTPAGLASSLRLAGSGAQANLWPRLPCLRIPVLVVTGDLDEKFTAIGDRIAAAIDGAARARIPGAGHAIPWERPDEFAGAVLGWLGDINPG